jgi:signal transduction histidine kinase
MSVARRRRRPLSPDAAHDLKQPINTVILTSDLLMRGPLTQSQRDQVQRIKQEAKRLSQMVNDLLQVALVSESS